MLWIGLLSGTSADAIDVALVRFGPSGGDQELIASLELPLSGRVRARVHEMAHAPTRLRDLMELDVALGEHFAQAAWAVVRQAGIPMGSIEGIGSHGQTAGHFPEPAVRASLQLGSAAVLHARTGRPVVSDFRAADLAAGGQGAPLTPYFHMLRFSHPDESRAVLNLGGFTNVTFLPGASEAGAVVAFDPGPGNALLDRAARWASEDRELCDREGARAARGRVLAAPLETLLSDPYFRRPPPKSTGHEHFGIEFFERSVCLIEQQSGTAEDLLATLTELTAKSVARAACTFFPSAVDRWLIYGGGVRNATLVGRLRDHLAPAAVECTDAHGVPHAALEAIAFAQLGWCAARGVPANLPSATGAERPVVLGTLTPPHAFASVAGRMHPGRVGRTARF